MKPISTFSHGIMDYALAVFLLIMPNLFGFTEVESAAMLSRIVGFIILGQALLTQYELGIVKLIPMRLHIGMDFVISIMLLLSPWIFGFNDAGLNVWLPFVLVGIGGTLAAMMSQTESFSDTGSRHPGRGGMRA